MDYKALKVLLTVIQKNNFEQAANFLHMTQSAVSQRIKQLEKSYGEPLLIRSTPYQATRLGEKLLAHYKKVALLESAIQRDLNDNPAPAEFAIALNRDSLESWFKRVFTHIPSDIMTLDIFSDDQAVTLNYLKRGLVVGAVSTEPKALNGCESHFLGIMDYLLVASPDFKKKHFKTLNAQTVSEAPAILFDNKDTLHAQYLKRFFKLSQMPRYHYIPSSTCFKQAALDGLGYGLIPEVEIKKELKEKSLINLARTKPWRMPLYWHHFSLENKKLKHFNEMIIQTAIKELKRT
jgi:LysR family transcriptional regulator (chromosome initiation inhibitor)